MSKVKLILALLVAAMSLNTLADDEPNSSMMFSKEPHTVQLLDIGGVSLNKMLTIIENAQVSVEISNYLIGYSDYSGILILDALKKRAKEVPGFQANVIIEDSTSGGYRKQNFGSGEISLRSSKLKALNSEFLIRVRITLSTLIFVSTKSM